MSSLHTLAAALATAAYAREVLAAEGETVAATELGRLITQMEPLGSGDGVSGSGLSPEDQAEIERLIAEASSSSAYAIAIPAAGLAWIPRLAKWAWPIAVGATARYGPGALQGAKAGFKAAWRRLSTIAPKNAGKAAAAPAARKGLSRGMRWALTAGAILVGAKWAGEELKSVGLGAQGLGMGVLALALAWWLLSD